MSLADDLHGELSQHGVISEGQAWRMHDRIAELEAELADALPAVRAEQRKTARAEGRLAAVIVLGDAPLPENTYRACLEQMQRLEARIAELEAEAATHKARAESELARSHRYETRLAELEAEAGRYLGRLVKAEARLTAVIALCDMPIGISYQEIRAAATGEMT